MAVLLIVEDDTATNEAICEYMSSAGHTTLSAFDGEQGLQIAREKSIDLVVLDIMLPKRTGLEVLKELRQTSGIRSFITGRNTPSLSMTKKSGTI